MLALFGLPHLQRVTDAYEDEHPLAEGWRDRVGAAPGLPAAGPRLPLRRRLRRPRRRHRPPLPLSRPRSRAGQHDQPLGRPGHRDVAVDGTLDAGAERLRVDEDDQVELETLRQLGGQPPDAGRARTAHCGRRRRR